VRQEPTTCLGDALKQNSHGAKGETLRAM